MSPNLIAAKNIDAILLFAGSPTTIIECLEDQHSLIYKLIFTVNSKRNEIGHTSTYFEDTVF